MNALESRTNYAMKSLILVCVAAIGIFVWHERNHNDTLEQIQRRLGALEAKASAPGLTSLETQLKCAQQSEKTWKTKGFKGPLDRYTSHFSQRHNKCFFSGEGILFDGDTTNAWAFVSDAFEGRDYATYNRITTKGRSGPMFLCLVASESGEMKECASRSEYNEHIKSYLYQ